MITPKLEFVGLKNFLKGLEEKKPIVEMGVAAEGAAAAYAHVWEWGNFRQAKQGPRTVRGINPDGESVWLSSQAPLGYIAVNVDKYVRVIKNELGEMRFSSETGVGLVKELEQSEKKIMTKVAEIMEDTAPVDTGQLKSSFEVVNATDDEMQDDKGGSIESRFKRVRNWEGNKT